MSRQFSGVTLAIVGVVAVGAGALFAPFSGAKLLKASKHKHVVITIQNNKCSQTAEGVRDSYTFLRRKAFLFSGDSVEWAVRDLDHHATDFVITFPQQTPDGHVGTPFVDANGNAKFVFTDNDNQSGGSPSGTNPDDYPYYSVSAGGVACSNPSDPGVHVDK
jgi:hypothetical protein